MKPHGIETRLRVFEHQALYLGQTYEGGVFQQHHLDALCAYHQRTHGKYYQLVHKGVKFSHYVGVIQVGGLLLEILPKTAAQNNGYSNWQSVLLPMLEICHQIKVEAINSAKVGLSFYSLLEVYVRLYLEEVHQLLAQDLLRMYERQAQNERVLKGRLEQTKQLQKNHFTAQYFYCQSFSFQYDNTLNRILLATLYSILSMRLHPNLMEQCQELISKFPSKIRYQAFQISDFNRISSNRNTSRFHYALQLAEVILRARGGSIQAGRYPLTALLFDMNVLFEEYVFQRLRRLRVEGWQVERQVQKPFWRRRKLRPDIILQKGTRTLVLDTKWKILITGQPTMDDLRQLFVYAKYFNAKKAIIVYPFAASTTAQVNEAFIPYTSQEEKINCQTIVAPLFKNGQLNANFANELISLITD